MGSGHNQNTGSKLKYVEEHISCKNYAAGECAVLGCIELKADETFVKENLGRSTLVFILRGSISISTAGLINRPVEEGHMLLVPVGDSFYARAITDATIMRSSFTQDMTQCNKFSLKQLLKYVPGACGTPLPAVLSIRELLFKELEITLEIMKTGFICIHYQQIKAEIVFMELRRLYTKEELARLFAPVLAKDGDFKTTVLQQLPYANDAKELMNHMDMAAATFKRKFQAAFGMSAGQWMIQKKKEKLLRDIVMTGMTIKELARKYGFTENYLTLFCRKHFDATPTELRARYSAPR